MKDQTLIPEATPPLDGEYVVELSLAQVAKILFSNKMALRGITRGVSRHLRVNNFVKFLWTVFQTSDTMK